MLKDKLYYVKNLFLSESARFSLWAPLWLALGIIIYFQLSFEPAMWVGPFFLMMSLWLLWIFKQRRPLTMVLVLMSLGFSVSQWRVFSIDTPVLNHELEPTTIYGTVIEIEHLEKTARLVLQDIKVFDLPKELTPHKVRLRLVNSEQNIPGIGDNIKIYAQLAPPSEPIFPAGFDFRRFMYFKSIGAVGYALGHPTILKPRPVSWGDQFFFIFKNIRENLIVKLHNALEGDTAEVASALLAGERNAISKEAMDDIRSSGLAHLLAISGLHMSLVAGLVFLFTRSLLATSSRLALHYPIKKWASVAGLIFGFFYMILVGMPIPAQRAIFMLSLVVLAVLFDREALNMRLVSFAALVVLIFSPESLLGPSFQMSFAAVSALIAFYESYKLTHPQGFGQDSDQGVMSYFYKCRFYVLGLMLTSLISSVATTPFAIYHFHNFVMYGVLTNLLAVPVTAFWVMPLGVVGVLCSFIPYNFGLDLLIFKLMGYGIDLILWSAHFVTELPLSILVLPQIMPIGLTMIVLGGLWMMIWKRNWRFVGAIPIVMGFMTMFFYQNPDILILPQGRLIGFVTQDQQFYVSEKRRDKFTAEVWQKSLGFSERHFMLQKPTKAQMLKKDYVPEKEPDYFIKNYQFVYDRPEHKIRLLHLDSQDIFDLDLSHMNEALALYIDAKTGEIHTRQMQEIKDRPWYR